MRILNNFKSASLNFFSNFQRNIFNMAAILIPVIILSCTYIFVETYLNNSFQVINDFNDNQIIAQSSETDFQYKDYLYNNLKYRSDMMIIPFVQDNNISAIFYKNNIYNSKPAKIIATSSNMIYSGIPIFSTNFPTVDKISIIKGNVWTKQDEINHSKVIVINKTMALLYFGKIDCIGYQLNLDNGTANNNYNIIGVIEDNLDDINQIIQYNSSDKVDKKLPVSDIYMPITTYFKFINKSSTIINTFIINENLPVNLPATNLIKDYLTKTFNGDYSVYSRASMISSINSYNQKINLYLQIPIYFVLILTYLGLTNSVINMINLRKEEIGIRKAYGASIKDIIELFLIEIISLLLFTTIFGLIISCIIVGLLSIHMHMILTVSVLTVIKIFFITVTPGVIFTVLPIIHNSKINIVSLLKQ